MGRALTAILSFGLDQSRLPLSSVPGKIVGRSPVTSGGTAADYLGSYGYNGYGVAGYSGIVENLGLGADYIPTDTAISLKLPTVTESTVLAPSDMVAIGDSRVYDDHSGSYQLFVPDWGEIWKLPPCHGVKCNIVFCDSHTETVDTANFFFNMTNSAIRWNNDHQSHPETW